MSVLTAINSSEHLWFEFNACISSWTTSILSEMSLPSTKAAWVSEMIPGSIFFSLLARIFEMILKATLHRLIGLNSFNLFALSFFGIRLMLVLFIPSSRVPVAKKALHHARYFTPNSLPEMLKEVTTHNIWTGTLVWVNIKNHSLHLKTILQSHTHIFRREQSSKIILCYSSLSSNHSLPSLSNKLCIWFWALRFWW